MICSAVHYSTIHFVRDPRLLIMSQEEMVPWMFIKPHLTVPGKYLGVLFLHDFSGVVEEASWHVKEKNGSRVYVRFHFAHHGNIVHWGSAWSLGHVGVNWLVQTFSFICLFLEVIAVSQNGCNRVSADGQLHGIPAGGLGKSVKKKEGGWWRKTRHLLLGVLFWI